MLDFSPTFEVKMVKMLDFKDANIIFLGKSFLSGFNGDLFLLTTLTNMKSPVYKNGVTWTNNKWFLYKLDQELNFGAYSCYEIDPIFIPSSEVRSMTVAETSVYTTE